MMLSAYMAGYDAEAQKDTVDQIVGERPLLGCVAQKHADDRAHLRLHLYDKDLLVIADEQGTTIVGRQNTTNVHFHHILFHREKLRCYGGKTSPSSEEIKRPTNYQ